MIFLAQAETTSAIDAINQLGNIEPLVLLMALAAVLVIFSIVLVRYEKSRSESYTEFLKRVQDDNQRLRKDVEELIEQLDEERRVRFRLEDQNAQLDRELDSAQPLREVVRQLRGYYQTYRELRQQYLQLEDEHQRLLAECKPEELEPVVVKQIVDGKETIPLPFQDETGQWVMPDQNARPE